MAAGPSIGSVNNDSSATVDPLITTSSVGCQIRVNWLARAVFRWSTGRSG
jgi:hypothetical protein